MRIGFDISKVLPPRDGIGTYSVELLNGMARLPGDHQLSLHSLLQPVDEVALRAALPELPDNVSLAARPLAEDRLDIFHSPTLAWPVGFRGPVVMTCHDLTFLTHPECHTLENRLHCLEGMLRAVLDGAHVVAVSAATAKAATAHFGIDGDRLQVVHSAAGVDMRPQEAAAARQRLQQLGLEGGYVLAVGTLEPRKNLLRLLEAHCALPAELRRRFPLAIAAGGGWRNKQLERRLEGADFVHRLGHVKRQQLADLYSCASAFVFPSLAEGFGLPILEAMACGAPVITANTTSMPEVAGDAALLVDPLDTASITSALERLLGDAALAADLRQRGLQRAALFSWPATAAATLDFYRHAVAGC